MARRRRIRKTWREEIEDFKRDFVQMSAEDITGYRNAYWPGGSGMSNSVRVRLIALIELVAEHNGIDLPKKTPRGYDD